MTRNLIAILRGVLPKEVEGIGAALIEAGIGKIEVPLNSPDAFDSISRLVARFDDQALIGAGTVLQADEVARLTMIGAKMIISPNCNPEVIRAAKAATMRSIPGVMTPGEALLALEAGADALKFFPGEVIGPTGLRAMRAILPADSICYAVGGVNAENFASWREAGADGFGIGSALFKPGDDAKIVGKKAAALIRAYDEAKQG